MIQDKQIYISDTLHNTVKISKYEKEIISTQLFNRLHNISQNSTAYLTFPANRTKRFEHSVGTMKICGEMFYYSINNAEEDVIRKFMKDTKYNIKKSIIDGVIRKYKDRFRFILGDKNLSKLEEYDDFNIVSCFYNDFIPGNITKKEQFLYLVLFQSIRIAALLHDIGHPPFSHITENALKRVFEEFNDKENKNERQEEFVEILNDYHDKMNKSQLHERMGNKMSRELLNSLINSKDVDGDFTTQYFKVLISETVMGILNEKSTFFKQLHRIIDGSIDGDRLDYVSRDVLNSGFDSGKIEYDRLISSMKLLIYEDDEYIFAISAKTLNTAEDFFFRRWNLYKNIIFHHRVIKTDFLLEESIYNIVSDYLGYDICKEDEVCSENYSIPNNISGLWKAIKLVDSHTEYFNSLIQWDDGWLGTVLKKHYFTDYYDTQSTIKYQLEELLSNKKQFYSVIKKSEDFFELDRNIVDNMEIDLQSFIKGLEDNGESHVEIWKEIDQVIKEYDYTKSGSFLSKIKFLLDSFLDDFYDDNYNFEDITRNIISNFFDEQYKESIESHFVVFKKIKHGLEKNPYVYKDNDIYLFDTLSNMKYILKYDKNCFPTFYLYVMSTKEYNNDKINVNKINMELSKRLSEEWNKFFTSVTV